MLEKQKKLQKQRTLELDELNPLTSSDLAMTCFHGLTKIYKSGTLVRPIVSLQGALIFGMARWLSSKLTLIFKGSSTNVNCACKYHHMVTGVTTAHNKIMVMLNLIALYTFITKQLWDHTFPQFGRYRDRISSGTNPGWHYSDVVVLITNIFHV